jgi:integrase
MAEPYLWKHPEYGTYTVIWMQDGKQRRKSLKTRDRKIANAKLNHFKRELVSGSIDPVARKGSGRRLFAFADEFEAHIETRTRQRTVKLYKTALAKAKSCWGDIKLSEIDESRVDAFITDMVRAGLKPPTVNKNLRHLKGVLKKAYRWKYLREPVQFPSALVEEEKLRFLSLEQLQALFAKIDDEEFYDMCLLAAFTGLRNSEIANLQWPDIDNPEGFIRVPSRQKNKKEDRIPINVSSRAVLDRAKDRGFEKVFRRIHPDTISHHFKAYVVKAGLPTELRFHDLRHTFASHLAMAGKSAKAIQKLMRHASPQSTDIYMKLSPEHLREVSESLTYGVIPKPPVISSNENEPHS